MSETGDGRRNKLELLPLMLLLLPNDELDDDPPGGRWSGLEVI